MHIYPDGLFSKEIVCLVIEMYVYNYMTICGKLSIK